jgi:hypothetical protein
MGFSTTLRGCSTLAIVLCERYPFRYPSSRDGRSTKEGSLDEPDLLRRVSEQAGG